eukprot:3001836-Rhodomonas_salina.3
MLQGHWLSLCSDLDRNMQKRSNWFPDTLEPEGPGSPIDLVILLSYLDTQMQTGVTQRLANRSRE